MKKLILIIALMFVLAVPVSEAAAGAPLWEVVTLTDMPADNADISRRENVEVEVVEGKILITVDRPVKVEIYSILGQLITSRQVKPGTVRLSLNQRGVYILKAGSTTRRVNL